MFAAQGRCSSYGAQAQQPETLMKSPMILHVLQRESKRSCQLAMCGAQEDEADAAAAKEAAEEAAAQMAAMNDDGLGEERRSVVLAEADAAASGAQHTVP